VVVVVVAVLVARNEPSRGARLVDSVLPPHRRRRPQQRRPKAPVQLRVLL
jgi:hypothetical protein